MIPERRLCALVAALLVPAALAVWPFSTAAVLPYWLFGLALLTGLASTDLALVWRPVALTVRRHCPPSLSLGRETRIGVELRAPVAVDLARWLDCPPSGCEGLAEGGALPLAPDHSGGVWYQVRPTRRGDLAFGPLTLWRRSPLGLWQRRQVLDPDTRVRVYPDFKAIGRYTALFSDNRSSHLGIHLDRRRGEGLEFEQLREYRDGDSLRQVDWKATARRHALISREYREERDQQVLFVLDAGRRMRSQDGELSHFDHAVNAMLLMAWVALREGDAVGLMTIGGGARWLPMQRGPGGVTTLLNTVYDLQPEPRAADFIAAAETIATRQRRRALVVLLTSLRDEDQDLDTAVRLLERRHLVMLGNLRERLLDDTLAAPANDFEEALTHLGAWRHLRARRRTQQALAQARHIAVDATPADLPPRLVNAYLRVKRSGRL